MKNAQRITTLLVTLAALFAGQQAFATITQTVTFKGMAYTQNNTSYYSLEINGSPWGNLQLPNQQGTYCQFNNVHSGWNSVEVTLNGKLRFQTSTTATDVVTDVGGIKVTFESQSLWFFGASVKKLDGTIVTNSHVTVSSDRHTVTVNINYEGTEFGQIVLEYVPNEPFSSSNTVIGGIEPLYIYGTSFTLEPTVTHNGILLTEGTDYTVSYPDLTTDPLYNTWVYNVTITGMGNYTGSISKSFSYRNVNLTDFNSLGNNTYEIATKQDLDYLALYVGTINESHQYNYCEGLTFKQTADIAYTYTMAWNSSNSGETNFTAIGGWGKPFKGTFDGQNHSISGIRISKNGYSDSAKCQGLFGYVYSGTVRNVVLADTRIRGFTGTGGIVGVNEGTIEDCRVQGNVLVKSSGIGSDTGISNDGSDFGGIAGSNNNGGTLTRCTSSATIDGFIGHTTHATGNTANNYSNNLGGIVGDNGGTVSNCLALNAAVTGDLYAAAIVGKNGGTLTANHYSSCTVTNRNHSNGSSISVGVGTDDGSEDQDGARSVHALTLPSNVTATGESVEINGTIYYASNTTVTLGYNGTVPAGQMPVYKVGNNTIEGNTFTMPAANRTVSVTFAAAWSGSGTQGSPYVITTAAQLDALANAVKSGETYSGKYFVLDADIAYSTVGLGDTDENFTTIGGYFNGSDKNFSGSFDGRGHTISGIRLYKNGTAAPSMNQGLFGRIDGATIQNVILTDAHITGYRYVGGLVGNIVSGSIQNCLVLESTITCADKYVGALFGKNAGTITANYYHNCTVNKKATGVGVGGNGGVSSSSDKNGARGVHTLTLGENITATGESVDYQNTTWYASNKTVTLGYNNLPTGHTVTYSLNGTALSGNTFTMPAADATVSATITALDNYSLDVTSATILGETKHVATFYQSTYDYLLPAGALAYTASLNGGKVVFHRIGENSNIIPANSAVIIIADAVAVTNGKITLTKLDSSSGVTAHSGNILQGSDVAIDKPASGTVYVLNIENNTLGFYQYNGVKIPAGKAYYVVE